MDYQSRCAPKAPTTCPCSEFPSPQWWIHSRIFSRTAAISVRSSTVDVHSLAVGAGLFHRQIHLLGVRHVQRSEFYVSGDAHDFPRNFVPRIRDMLSDRICRASNAWPSFHSRWSPASAGLVAFTKRGGAQQGGPRRVEVFRKLPAARD